MLERTPGVAKDLTLALAGKYLDADLELESPAPRHLGPVRGWLEARGLRPLCLTMAPRDYKVFLKEGRGEDPVMISPGSHLPDILLGFNALIWEDEVDGEVSGGVDVFITRLADRGFLHVLTADDRGFRFPFATPEGGVS